MMLTVCLATESGVNPLDKAFAPENQPYSALT